MRTNIRTNHSNGAPILQGMVRLFCLVIMALPLVGQVGLGDYSEDYASVAVKFSTATAAKVPTTLSGSPVVSVFTVRGTAKTDANGQWVDPMMLHSGLSYTIAFYKTGVYGVSTAEITV